jgi:hypothetical protein
MSGHALPGLRPRGHQYNGTGLRQSLRGTLLEQAKRQPNIRQDLALCIMRLFDEGENRPLRLSRMALHITTIVTGSDGQRVSLALIPCNQGMQSFTGNAVNIKAGVAT